MENLNIVITADVKSALNGLNSINSQLSNLSSSSGSSATQSINTMTKTAKSGTGSIIAGLSKLTIVVQTLRQAFKYLGKSIEESMDYGETINLFQTSMRALGKKSGNEFAFLDRAESFSSTIATNLGLDPNMLMNYQAVFAQMTSSMGVTESAAYDLSESFTMLGADISSLFNIDVDTAYKKLQSALSGQTRGLRELGVDISMATMREKAYALGINKSVTSMTQAEKTQFRYMMIMEGLTVAQGDMARTLESPANQLRILSAQFVQLTRAIGNIFLPAVTAVLPYINAVVMGLKNALESIAALVGYKIPDFKYTPVEIFDSDDAAGDVDGVTESVKKLKKATLGMDELNILSDNSDAAASGAAGGSSIDLSSQIAETNAAYKAMVDDITNQIGGKTSDIVKIWGNAFEQMGNSLGIWVQKFKPAMDSIKNAIVSALPSIKASFGSIGSSVSMLWQSNLLPIANYVFNDWFPRIVNSFGTNLAPKIIEFHKNTLAGLSEVFDWAVNLMNGFTEPQLSLLDNMAETVELTVIPAVSEMLKTFETFGSVLFDILKPIVEDAIIPAFHFLYTVVTDLFTTIDNIWAAVGEPVFSAFREAIEAVGKIFDSVWKQFLKPIIDNLFIVLNELWVSTLQPLFEKIGIAVGKVVELVLVLWNKVLAPLVDFVVNLLAPAFSSVINFIVDIFHSLVKAVGGVINGLLDTFNGLIDFICGIFTGNWKRALAGIVNIFVGMGNAIISVFEGVVNFVIDLANGLVSLLWGAIKGVINSILGAVEWIAKWVGFDLNIKIDYNMPKIPKLTIPRIPLMGYATGGIPNYGELFMAREGGITEMIGSFGNHTGVANNEQIVQGIASGVADANGEQNAILREQNSLLRRILEKDTTVSAVLSTTDIIGGISRKNRRDGKTIIPVGV